MKKFTFLLFFVSVLAYVQAENVMYTRFSQSTRTLTYYYGVKPSGSNYEQYNPGTGNIRFKGYAKEIDIVVIDASMLNVHPTNLREMFYGGHINITDSLRLVNLKEIRGLENLQTDEAVTLEEMFYGCESLQSIDLSHFNTSKVKIFSGMFYACAALTSLDLSSFETSAATKMERMFGHCKSLTHLDLSNFNTENVTDMAGMFIRCDALETLDISSFNTGNVTDMQSMFNSCAVLKTLDISNFDFSKVTRVDHMFQYNHALETIYCNTDFNELTSLESSDAMFGGCFALVGGNGTTYDTSLPKDKTYARPDGLDDQPGYFTAASTSGKCGENLKWVLKKGVLTISGTGPMEDYSKETDAPWYSERESITSVIIENGVTTVGRKAFMYYSTITSITLPKSLTAIGDDAFRSASIESITIPANVASIGNLTFRNCTLLKTINVLPTTPPTLGTLPFSNLASDYVIYVPAAAFGAYKTADGWKDLNIQTEGGGSSGTCGENVNWELIGGVLTISGTGPMEEYASKNYVPWYPDHKSIVSVIIEDGVTVIGKNAFFDCINMTSAQIGKGVTKINNYAFKNCSSLSAVAISRNVTNIGKEAFSNCSSLTELTCEATTPPTCGDNVFDGVTNTIPVYVPKGYISAYQAADDWNEFTNIQAIPDGTFGPCGENVNWDLTDGVLTISGSGPMTDYKSSSNVPWRSARESITSIVIENGVTSIGQTAFYGCIKLPSVTIPSSITSIGESALRGCTGLKEITCEATTPPTCGADAFLNIKTSIPVYVPAESIKAYRTADGWNYFTNITIPLTPEEQVEVNKVIDLINAIFDAPITLDSEAAITAARNAFDALSSLLQTAVINYDLLQDAEKTLAALKANIPTVDDNWVFYDNGVYNTSYNTGGNEAWAIFIPANTTSKKSILRINTYIHVPGEYEVEFYAGGATPAEGTKLSSEVVSMPNADEFNEVTLSNPVAIDPTQDIWVVMKNINGYSAPMTACDLTGAVNASWLNLDGTWMTTADVGYPNIAWMIRVFFATYTGEALIDGIRYYLSGDDMTAEVMPLGDGYYAGDIVLPEKVSYMKNDYAVTSVAGAAFSNCPELLTVTIPKSVNWIEPEVFYDSPKLTAVNVAAANADYSSLDGVLFNKAQTELRAYPTAKEHTSCPKA